MVRKWSYLNLTELPSHPNLKSLKKTKTFKVFRHTTKFKKFTRGLTKSVRQKYTQRKFYTSYFSLPQITKYWSFSYMQLKQVERFVQSFQYNPVLSNVPNIDVFYENTKTLEKTLNLHLLSCSKTLVYRFTNIINPNKNLFNVNNIKNAKLSFSQTTSFDLLHQNDVTFPLNITVDNISYHPLENNPKSLYNSTFSQMNNSLFTYNLNLILNYYKILIHLTLLKTIK